MQKKQQYYKQYADQRRRAHNTNIQQGQFVRHKIQVRNKLDPVWSAPFRVISKPSTDTVKLEDNTVWNSRDLLLRSKSDADHHSIEQPTAAVEPATPIDDESPADESSEEESRSPRTISDLSEPDQPKDPPLLDAGEPVRRSTRERHPPARY